MDSTARPHSARDTPPPGDVDSKKGPVPRLAQPGHRKDSAATPGAARLVSVGRPRVWAFTHWILYNIPLTETSIAAGAADAGLHQKGIEAGENSLGGHAYFGPCAPIEHRYLIRVYALDVPQIRPQTNDRQGINDAMKGHILSFGELAIRAGP